MKKINVLSSDIYNRISAGEVVERPATIIKELVENSIDAGAKNITIDIVNGGITKIKICDNGSGISREDMKTAFLAHATSKILDVSDLDNIATLGFRGEALPSISAVSDVKMISRTSVDEIGYSVQYSYSQLIDEGECGAALGTTVQVLNLFERIPARAKFLKKAIIEQSEITALVEKMILSNHNISFSYVCDGNLQYYSSGEGLESAIYSIYGEEFLANMLAVNSQNLTNDDILSKKCGDYEDLHSTTSDIVLHGYVSKPIFSKSNRTYQTLIVNGRYIINNEISAKIYSLYSNYLMTRQFPVYILFLDLPYDDVDVNVHPNKKEVKFKKIEDVFATIQNVVLHALDEEARKVNVASSSNVHLQQNIMPNNMTSDFLNLPKVDGFIKYKPIINDNFSSPTQIEQRIFSQIVADKKEPKVSPEDTFHEGSLLHEKRPCMADKIDNANCSQEQIEHADSYLYVGKLFNTYLLLEYENTFLLIDQHAGHERLLYDEYMAQIDSTKIAIQPLLIPYVFEVTAVEADQLTNCLSDLLALGFACEEFGKNTYRITEVPAVCSTIDFQDFVADLLKNLKNYNSLKRSQFIKDKIAQTACKAAVKGEMDLSKYEIDSLIGQIAKSNMKLFCPHGRPVVVTFPRSEVEKWFKRLV